MKNRFMGILFILAIIVGVYLICLLGYLSYLNWSYKVQASLVSIVLVGTGTILVTIFSGLKDQKVSSKLVTAVFVGENDTKFAVFPNEKSRLYSRSQLLHTYTNMAGRSIQLDAKIDPNLLPATEGEWLIFNREAFIYELFKQIAVLSVSGATFELDGSRKTIGIQNIELPKDVDPVMLKQVQSKFEWFNGMNLDIDYKSQISINLPEKTSVKIYNVNIPGEREKTVIEFFKNRYFKISFSLSRITDANSDQAKKFGRLPADSKIRSYAYLLEMEGDFDKYSSSGDRSISYVTWCNSLFAAIKEKFDDSRL